MNKHLFIWVVVLIGGGVIALAIWPDDESLKKETLINEKSTLDSLITVVGGGMYDKEKFNDLDMKIRGAYSNGDLSNSRKDLLLQNLNLSMQHALTNSMNSWFITNCTNEILLKQLNSKAKEQSSPIPLLNKAMGMVSDYSYSKSFSEKLNRFVSGEYSVEAANKLKRDFLSSLSGKPFRNCPSINMISDNINTELYDFDQFYNSIYLIKIKRVELDPTQKESLDFFKLYSEKMEQLKHYDHYYKIYQSLVN